MRFVPLLAAAAGLHVAATIASAAITGRRARHAPGASMRPEKWPSVSVIVPAWREAGTVGRCIQALAEVDYPVWEVIIAAGGSDATFDAARRATADQDRFKVIRQGSGGKNAALNEGIAHSSGEVIAFLDADSVPQPDWLAALVARLDAHTRAVTGWAVPLRPTVIARAELLERISAYEVHRHVVLQGSASIAIWRPVLDAMGSLPEDVYAGVDWDLDTRLADAGVHRAFARDAVVHTERPATLAEFWQNEVRWRRAHLASIARHRAHGFDDGQRLLRDFYIYGVAWVTIATSAMGVLALASGARHIYSPVIGLWGVGIGWIALRRAAVVIQVAVYTGEPRWLGLLPVLPALLGVTFAAICVATLTPNRHTIHFKGPRRSDRSPA